MPDPSDAAAAAIGQMRHRCPAGRLVIEGDLTDAGIGLRIAFNHEADGRWLAAPTHCEQPADRRTQADDGLGRGLHAVVPTQQRAGTASRLHRLLHRLDRGHEERIVAEADAGIDHDRHSSQAAGGVGDIGAAAMASHDAPFGLETSEQGAQRLPAQAQPCGQGAFAWQAFTGWLARDEVAQGGFCSATH